MNIHIIYVGRREARHLQPAIDEYAKRLTPFAALSWQAIVSQPTGDGSIESSRQKESALIEARLSPGDMVVLLDERGKQFDNRELADFLDGRRQQARQRLVFIIGGAYGVSEGLRQRADLVWSLSRLVFPHELVRLLLIEQLYRSSAILSNKAYHH